MSKNCVILTRYFYTVAERSDKDLDQQLGQAESIVEALVRPELEPHQYEALVCLVSDILAGLADAPVAFEKSFLLTAINKGMLQVAAAEFHTFCYVNGRVQTRAWEKRKAEMRLFTLGTLLFHP